MGDSPLRKLGGGAFHPWATFGLYAKSRPKVAAFCKSFERHGECCIQFRPRNTGAPVVAASVERRSAAAVVRGRELVGKRRRAEGRRVDSVAAAAGTVSVA